LMGFCFSIRGAPGRGGSACRSRWRRWNWPEAAFGRSFISLMLP